MKKPHRYSSTLGTLLFISLVGCASAPPQVAQLHQKEKEIIQSLQKSHLALLDRLIRKRIDEFERFYFKEYRPTYKANWKKAFQEKNGRPYDDQKDSLTLDKDMVAEYLEKFAPLEKMRADLRTAITTEYRNALNAHKEIGGWLSSIEKLNVIKRLAIDKLMEVIKPGLTIKEIEETINQAIDAAKKNIKNQLKK